LTLVTLAPRHIGWSVGGDVVASTRLEREGDALRIVDVSYDDRGALAGLFDALVAVATAELLVGRDPVLAHCGFSGRGDGWQREIRPVAGQLSRTAAVTLGALESAIRSSWSAETCCDPGGWTPENPAYQQCDVTSRVVQDYLGGTVVVAGVVRDGRRVDRHAWNVLASGLAVDLTREQFVGGEELEEPSAVDEYLGKTVDERYRLLSERVRARLS
jgi:hypothetical protein